MALEVQKDDLEDSGLKTVTSLEPLHADAIDFPEAPSTYRPGKGGASIDGGSLTVTDAAGKNLLKVNNIDGIKPISRLVRPGLNDGPGTLLCGWT